MLLTPAAATAVALMVAPVGGAMLMRHMDGFETWDILLASASCNGKHEWYTHAGASGLQLAALTWRFSHYR